MMPVRKLTSSEIRKQETRNIVKSLLTGVGLTVMVVVLVLVG